MHWFNYGHPIEDRMGRVPIGFNVDDYLARYPDLAGVFGGITPKARGESFGRRVRLHDAKRGVHQHDGVRH